MRLLEALVADGALSADAVAGLRAVPEGEVQRTAIPAIVEASYRFLAHSPARLLIASLEDVLGDIEQTNVTGTVFDHPNWRRKVPRALEENARDPRFAGFASALLDVRALPAPPTVPSATFRLQFQRGFTFTDAERLVPYLANLGISHVYASPFLAARSGSPHGYDIVDHNELNPEVGTRAEFERFVDALHRQGMGLLLDFVPNHMGVGPENPWWMDVLEVGPRVTVTRCSSTSTGTRASARCATASSCRFCRFAHSAPRWNAASWCSLSTAGTGRSASVTTNCAFRSRRRATYRILGPAVELGRELAGGARSAARV